MLTRAVGAILFGSAAVYAVAQVIPTKFNLDELDSLQVSEVKSQSNTQVNVTFGPGNSERVSFYLPADRTKKTYSSGFSFKVSNIGGSREQSCKRGLSILRALMLERGYNLSRDSDWAIYNSRCNPASNGMVGIYATNIFIVQTGAAPTPPVVEASCKADAYLGAWQRRGEGKQGPNVQIVFATQAGASAPVGSTRGFAGSPYGEGTVIASRIKQGKDSCTYNAQCGSNLSSANSCKIIVDPGTNSLTIKGGSQMFVSDVAWFRAKPMAAAATCEREDVEGNWRRSDGAIVPIVGVHVFKNGPGGNALLFNHPEGRWPKGEHKFSSIKRVGGERSCKMTAVCATYDFPSGKDAVRRERNCTLTIDPIRKRMTESGSSLTYTRMGATKGGETVKLNNEAYEAEVKRIAEEQAAKEEAYRKALADQKAKIEENARKAQQARARWEAAVAACKAGDHSQCASTR